MSELTLDFIINKAANKFVDDVDNDIWKYKRFLERRMKKSKYKAKYKKLLQDVNTRLGVKEKIEVIPERTVSSRDYKEEEKAKKAMLAKAAQVALDEHFGD